MVLTIQQKTVSDNVGATLRQMLNPERDRSESLLWLKKDAFLKAKGAALASDPEYKDDPDKRAAKLAAVATQFDQKVTEMAQAGAVEGADPRSFKKVSVTEDATKRGFIGASEIVLDTIIGSLGGAAAWIWNLLKRLPVVGNMLANFGSWMSDKFTGTPPENAIKEGHAAGIANALGNPIDIAGQVVTFTPEERAQLYRQMSTQDFSKPAIATAEPPASQPARREPDSFQATNGLPPGTPGGLAGGIRGRT